MASRLRRLWSWLWRLPPPPPDTSCPDCDRPVVAAPEWHHDAMLGPVGGRRTRAELLASCPVHGRRPYNNVSRTSYRVDSAAGPEQP